MRDLRQTSGADPNLPLLPSYRHCGPGERLQRAMCATVRLFFSFISVLVYCAGEETVLRLSNLQPKVMRSLRVVF